MVARADRSSRVTLCGFLLDVYCLGVKNTLDPLTVSSSAVQDPSHRFLSGFPDLPRPVPLKLAQHLVHGDVAYAASLGFDPHKELPDVQPFLGPGPGPCPTRFGRHGTPWYIAGRLTPPCPFESGSGYDAGWSSMSAGQGAVDWIAAASDG